MRSCIVFFVVQTVIMVGCALAFRDVQTNHLFKCSKWLKANACYQANIFSTQYMRKKMHKHDLFKVSVRLRVLSFPHSTWKVLCQINQLVFMFPFVSHFERLTKITHSSDISLSYAQGWHMDSSAPVQVNLTNNMPHHYC